MGRRRSTAEYLEVAGGRPIRAPQPNAHASLLAEVACADRRRSARLDQTHQVAPTVASCPPNRSPVGWRPPGASSSTKHQGATSAACGAMPTTGSASDQGIAQVALAQPDPAAPPDGAAARDVGRHLPDGRPQQSMLCPGASFVGASCHLGLLAGSPPRARTAIAVAVLNRTAVVDARVTYR